MKKKTCMLAVAIAATFNSSAKPTFNGEDTKWCQAAKILNGDIVATRSGFNSVSPYEGADSFWTCYEIKSLTNGSGEMELTYSGTSQSNTCSFSGFRPTPQFKLNCPHESDNIALSNRALSYTPSHTGGGSSGGGGGGAGIAIGAIGVIGLAVYTLSPNSSSEFTPHFSYEGDIEYGGELKWTADNVGGVLSVDNLQNYSASIGYTANNFSIDLESDGIGYSISTRYQYGMSRNWSLIPTANYSDTRQSFSLKLTKELK